MVPYKFARFLPCHASPQSDYAVPSDHALPSIFEMSRNNILTRTLPGVLLLCIATISSRPLDAQEPAASPSAVGDNAKNQQPTAIPLSPSIAEASSEAEDAMSSFRIPDGWKISLFAAEPNVANIVAFDVDNQGRVFACESFRQNKGVTDNRGHDEVWLKRDLAAQTVQDRIDYHRDLLGEGAKTYTEQDDRIRLLVDTDGDGKADESLVYSDTFNQLEDGTGAGVLARGNQVYYTNIPKLYSLIDEDGDGQADEKVVLSDGFGVRVAFRGHDMHGLVIGPDGRLYFSIGDRGYHVQTTEGTLLHDPASGAVFRCELDGSHLEVFAKGLRNPQELAFNDYGDLFTGDNNSDSGDKARLVHVLRGGDTGWRMFYQYLPDRGPFNRDKIWEPFHDAQPAYIVPPIINFGDGPAGLTFYPGTGFGDQLKDNFLLADFRGGPSNSGIRAFRLESDGAFYELAEDSEMVWSILATDVAFGPDGGLYISDWVNGWDGEGKGRIYRLTDPGHSASELVQEVQNLLASDWSTHADEKLGKLLAHPDRRVRFESQWELASRKLTEPLTALAANEDAETRPRLHAIWGLEQIVRQSKDKRFNVAIVRLIENLLGTSDDYLRAAAAKFAGEHANFGSDDAITTLISDSSPRVRYFAAMAAGERKIESALQETLEMLAANDNQDPALRHAGIMALTNIASPETLTALKAHPSANVRRAVVVALRNQGSALLSQFLIDGDVRVIGEAARAIHDAPISEAIPALAAMLARSIPDVEIARRVLNANFRIGTAETASAIAEFAGRQSTPEELKLEALEMLGEWALPDQRDRILNDWHPLPERDAAIPAVALKSNLAAILSSSEQVRNKAITLASELGLSEVTPLLTERLSDPNLPASSRAMALRAMSNLLPEVAVERARKILADNDSETELRIASIETLSDVQPEQSLELILASTKSEQPVGEQQAAWDALAMTSSPATSKRLGQAVQSWISGSLASAVTLNVVDAVRTSGDQSLNEKLDSVLKQKAEQNPLAPWELAIDGGDVARGAEIFFTKTELSCVRCHKVGSQGGEVGPNLTQIAKEKDKKYLLESIVFPDSQIAKGYETTVLADDLGTVHTGIVKAENDQFIDLIKADGSQVKLLKDEIVGRRRGQSAMPADLTNYMTKRELRDLIAYLATLNQEPQGDESGHQVE